MKYAYVTAALFLVSGCLPEDSCQEKNDAQVREMMQLHEQRMKDWGSVGDTEVYEGFK
jgi:hypothetical protein